MNFFEQLVATIQPVVLRKKTLEEDWTKSITFFKSQIKKVRVKRGNCLIPATPQFHILQMFYWATIDFIITSSIREKQLWKRCMWGILEFQIITGDILV